ncbi:hypothetical protein ACLOJK_036335, partial [Asimina triloba]
PSCEAFPITSAILATRPPHKAATFTPRPSHKVTILAPWPPHKAATTAPPSSSEALLVASATLSKPQPSHKAAISTTWPSYKVTSVTVVAAPTSASRPLNKVAIPTATAAATSASRSACRTPYIICLYSSQVAHAQSGLRKDKRRLRKAGPISRRTTRLNRQDAQPLPPGPRYDTSRSGSQRGRKVPSTTLKIKLTVTAKRGDLPSGWR